MGVMLQAFFRRGTGGVPSPVDGGANTPWWWDHVASQARSLRSVGFTAIWLPPPFKGAAGGLSVGYDVFDDYDLGAKPQRGTVATRYGTRDQLARCTATLRACGLDVYLDLVENQRSGGNAFRYRYRDAAGGDGGRFPKDRDNFHPNVPQDPGVFGGPRAREISFGDDLAIVNARPKDYVSKGLIDATSWLVRTLDVQGCRLDDAKGVSTEFVPKLLGSGALAGKFAVGEFFDGDRGLLQRWIADTQRRAAVFDFPLRFTLARMCNESGGFDMGSSLDHAGLAGVDPLMAVTFVENHDTDTRPELQPVIANKLLAYAYILTAEGYPCVFYRDYSTDPGCYGLKPKIDNLVWIHEKLAAGPTRERWKEVGLYVYERLGGPRLLVALNKDDWQSRTVTVDTGFGANVKLHDYTGHSPDTWTNGFGQATITVPPNRGGLGYACFSRDGQGGGFALDNHETTQTFEGAPDLDIQPAGADAPTPAGRIWVGAGKPITVSLAKVEPAELGAGASLAVTIEGPDGKPMAQGSFTRAGHANDGKVGGVAKATGWHRITVQAHGTPAAHRRPSFVLQVRYTAPSNVSAAELATNA